MTHLQGDLYRRALPGVQFPHRLVSLAEVLVYCASGTAGGNRLGWHM